MKIMHWWNRQKAESRRSLHTLLRVSGTIFVSAVFVRSSLSNSQKPSGVSEIISSTAYRPGHVEITDRNEHSKLENKAAVFFLAFNHHSHRKWPSVDQQATLWAGNIDISGLHFGEDQRFSFAMSPTLNATSTLIRNFSKSIPLSKDFC